MGLASLLLGDQNPFSQWVGENNNYLATLGAGIAQGPDIQSGLAAGLANIPQAKQLDRTALEKRKADALTVAQANSTKAWLQQHRPDLAQMVEAGLPVSQAWAEALKPAEKTAQTQDIQEYEYAKAGGFGGTFQEWMQTGKNGAKGPQLGMQPQWAMDPSTGKYVLGQLSSDGTFHQTEMGGLTPVDPMSMQGGKTAATVDARTAGAAKAALPAAEQAMAIALKSLDLVRGDEKGLNEQFGTILGVPQRNLPVYPGSALGNWQANFAQAKGAAFLQARNILKGAGQITDYEGRRAEAAYSRMETAAASGDRGTFLAAADDFEEAIRDGFAKLQEVASGAYQPQPQGGQQAAPQAPAGGDEIDQILKGYNL